MSGTRHQQQHQQPVSSHSTLSDKWAHKMHTRRSIQNIAATAEIRVTMRRDAKAEPAKSSVHNDLWFWLCTCVVCLCVCGIAQWGSHNTTCAQYATRHSKTMAWIMRGSCTRYGGEIPTAGRRRRRRSRRQKQHEIELR